MRILSLISLAAVPFGCHNAQIAPANRVSNEIRFECQGPRRGKPPGHWYRCTIDVLDVAQEERWLLLPTLLEDALAPTHRVVVQTAHIESEDKFEYFSLGYHTDAFNALPIPAGTRLHLEKWRLETVEEARQMTIWLGATPRLSNGDTLSVIFQRVRTRTPEAANQPEPGFWKAPPATTLELAPSGFRQIQLSPPAP